MQYDFFELKETPLQLNAEAESIYENHKIILINPTIDNSEISSNELINYAKVENTKGRLVAGPSEYQVMLTPSKIVSRSLANPDIKRNSFTQDFSMSNGFIKLSREAEELAFSYPTAFAILSCIAFKAKRKETKLNQHLEFEEAEFNCCQFEDLPQGRKLTRQNVRTILNFLEGRLYLTTRSTGRFMYVKLLDKSVYDINSEEGQPQGQPLANRKLTASQPQAQVHHNNIRRKEISLSKDKEYVADAPISDFSSKKKDKGEASNTAKDLLAFFNQSLAENVPECAGKISPLESAHWFDKLLLNGYELSEIKATIIYAHKNEFWACHVHNPFYLKKKFPSLLAQKNRKKTENTNNKIDRRTKNIDGSPVSSPVDGRF